MLFWSCISVRITAGFKLSIQSQNDYFSCKSTSWLKHSESLWLLLTLISKFYIRTDFLWNCAALTRPLHFEMFWSKVITGIYYSSIRNHHYPQQEKRTITSAVNICCVCTAFGFFFFFSTVSIISLSCSSPEPDKSSYSKYCLWGPNFAVSKLTWSQRNQLWLLGQWYWHFKSTYKIKI